MTGTLEWDTTLELIFSDGWRILFKSSKQNYGSEFIDLSLLIKFYVWILKDGFGDP